MTARATFTVHPELRRLRDAWSWARGHMMTVDFMGADCPALREVEIQPGVFIFVGHTVTGGGMAVSINAEKMQIAHSETEQQTTINLLLPARYQRSAPAKSGGCHAAP